MNDTTKVYILAFVVISIIGVLAGIVLAILDAAATEDERLGMK